MSDRARGVTVVTDIHPETVRKFLRRPRIISELVLSVLTKVSHPSILMKVVTGGSHGNSRKSTRSCSRSYASHLHVSSCSYRYRTGCQRNRIFDDRALKALARRERLRWHRACSSDELSYCLHGLLALL